MLKSMSWKNMINYRDRHDLCFNNGVNFITGANGTGKSSILEMIRRCHSQKLNSTFSNVFDKNELAYVVCLYEECQEYLLGNEFCNADTNRMLSCIFYEKGLFIKIVCFRGCNESEGKLIVAATRYDCSTQVASSSKPFRTASKFLGMQAIDGEETRCFLDAYFGNTPSKNDVENRFLDLICQHLDEGQSSGCDMVEHVLEKILPAFVAVFPMRSLAPVQWTNTLLKTEANKEDLRKNHYRESYRASDILKDLLPDASETTISGINEKQEEEYYQNIIHPMKYEFVKSEKDEEIKVIAHKTSGANKEFPLLKTPEGVIEAKQASLILAHEKFKTICFEDMGKGMQHQMIENMSHFVLKPMDKKEQSKTLIVVTHQQSFIDSWSLNRTFICTRQSTDQDEHFVHAVRRVPDGYKYGYDNEMKKALFAANVLFVEGRVDLEVLRTFFNFMLVDEKELKRICTNIKMEDTSRMVRAIANTQIIALGGAEGRKKAMAFCRKIRVPAMVLIDRDAVKGKQPEKEHNWKAGTIEDVIRKDCSPEFLTAIGVTKKSENENKDIEKDMRGILKNKIKNEFKDSHYENMFRDICVDESSELGQFLIFFLKYQNS